MDVDPRIGSGQFPSMHVSPHSIWTPVDVDGICKIDRVIRAYVESRDRRAHRNPPEAGTRRSTISSPRAILRFQVPSEEIRPKIVPESNARSRTWRPRARVPDSWSPGFSIAVGELLQPPGIPGDSARDLAPSPASAPPRWRSDVGRVPSPGEVLQSSPRPCGPRPVERRSEVMR